MSKNRPVTEVVRRTAFTVQSTDQISEVYRLMKSRSLAHVTVVQQAEIVGIISRKAIRLLGFGYEFNGYDDVETGILGMLQANQVMERDTPQIALTATIEEVAELMAQGGYTALPVVYDGQPIGTIDINDVVLFLLKGP